MSKRITVYSDDPKTPRLVLSLKGEILVDVEVIPRQIYFGQVQKGKSATKNFTVKIKESEKIKIKDITLDDPVFAVEKMDDVAALKGQSHYKLTFKGADKLGPLATKMHVKLTGYEKEELTIRVGVREITGDINYSKRIYFRKRNDKYDEREIIFSSRSGKKIKLSNPRDEQSVFKYKISDHGNNRKKIVIKIANPEKIEKVMQGIIKVNTSDPDEKVVEIKYTISAANRNLRRVPGFVNSAANAKKNNPK